MIKRGVYYFS